MRVALSFADLEGASPACRFASWSVFGGRCRRSSRTCRSSTVLPSRRAHSAVRTTENRRRRTGLPAQERSLTQGRVLGQRFLTNIPLSYTKPLCSVLSFDEGANKCLSGCVVFRSARRDTKPRSREENTLSCVRRVFSSRICRTSRKSWDGTKEYLDVRQFRPPSGRTTQIQVHRFNDLRAGTRFGQALSSLPGCRLLEGGFVEWLSGVRCRLGRVAFHLEYPKMTATQTPALHHVSQSLCGRTLFPWLT